MHDSILCAVRSGKRSAFQPFVALVVKISVYIMFVAGFGILHLTAAVF